MSEFLAKTMCLSDFKKGEGLHPLLKACALSLVECKLLLDIFGEFRWNFVSWEQTVIKTNSGHHLLKLPCVEAAAFSMYFYVLSRNQ